MAEAKAKGQAPVVADDDWMKSATPAQLLLTGALVAASNHKGALPLYDQCLIDDLIREFNRVLTARRPVVKK